jgi:hypothetical protein
MSELPIRKPENGEVLLKLIIINNAINALDSYHLQRDQDEVCSRLSQTKATGDRLN